MPRYVFTRKVSVDGGDWNNSHLRRYLMNTNRPITATGVALFIALRRSLLFRKR
jgi:hypothetical protein